MKKTKGRYLRIWSKIGVLFVIGGSVISVLTKNEMIALIAVIGIGISVVTSLMGKSVYVCPECKTEFRKINDKFYLKTYSISGMALLTCPKCKKTNFMRRKLVSKDELTGL